VRPRDCQAEPPAWRVQKRGPDQADALVVQRSARRREEPPSSDDQASRAAARACALAPDSEVAAQAVAPELPALSPVRPAGDKARRASAMPLDLLALP